MNLHIWDMYFDNLYLVSNYLPKGWLIANIVSKKLRTQIQNGQFGKLGWGQPLKLDESLIIIKI
jgi:hypothetical protein